MMFLIGVVFGVLIGVIITCILSINENEALALPVTIKRLKDEIVSAEHTI